MSLEKHYRMIIWITSWKAWFVQTFSSLHYSIRLSALDVCMYVCIFCFNFNPIQDGPFIGLYLNKNYINHVKVHLRCVDISTSSLEITNVCDFRICRQKLTFNTYFLILVWLIKTLKLDQHDCNFYDVSKIGYSKPTKNKYILREKLWRCNLVVINRLL